MADYSTAAHSLDVSVEETSICVMDAGGTVLHESKVKSTPAAISRALHRHAPEAERIGIEAGASSSWLCRQLREAGHRIIHMESRHAHRALSMRLNKTDKNDARGLADLMRVGWFKSVHSRTLDSQYTRSMLLARKRLVDTKRQFENQLRNIMKVFGCMLGSTAGRGFVQRVEAACKNDPVVHRLCEPILRLVRELRLQINAYERQLRAMARHDETTRRMMTVPGIGALTALAFKSSIDNPHRFRHSADVGAFLGLTPRRHQSGEMDWTGRISRLGDGLVRTYLFEAASVLTGKIERWSRLKAWGVRLARRVGMKKARVAVARKLAVVLHSILGRRHSRRQHSARDLLNPLGRADRPAGTMGMVTSQRSSRAFGTARVTMRRHTDVAHDDGSPSADLVKNAEPGSGRSGHRIEMWRPDMDGA